MCTCIPAFCLLHLLNCLHQLIGVHLAEKVNVAKKGKFISNYREADGQWRETKNAKEKRIEDANADTHIYTYMHVYILHA